MITVQRVPGWEEHLVARAKNGELVAYELLADLHRGAVRNHALKLLRHRDDAEDAAQETFVKAYRALHTFDEARPILPWLMRICSNCCVDMLRYRKTRPECIERYEHRLYDLSPSAEDAVETSMEGEQLRDAIGRLPDRYREIIWMRHYKQMDVLEIAASLQKPEGTVKSWLHRARAMLRKDLQVAIG